MAFLASPGHSINHIANIVEFRQGIVQFHQVLRRFRLPSNLEELNADLPGFSAEPAAPEPQHVPAYIAARIYDQFEAWRQTDQLGGFELLFLDQHAASLMNICGACERIQKSPISLSYRWFIRQSIILYLMTLPFGLVDSFRWWTIVAVTILGYFMIGMEMIAENIEDPFGHDEDDIMLDDICHNIERSVRDILKESP